MHASSSLPHFGSVPPVISRYTATPAGGNEKICQERRSRSDFKSSSLLAELSGDLHRSMLLTRKRGLPPG